MASPRLPLAPDGWPFVLLPLGVAGVLAWGGRRRTALPFLALGGFMTWFFRDPDRVAPDVAGAVLAPADGRVMDVREGVEDAFVGPAQEVAIFLSPLDVHVNRAPIAGLVVAVERRRGGFRPAYDREGSALNEQTRLHFEGAAGRVVVRQVAGALARRIVCRVRPGDKLAAGERFGMIKFGSRTDVVMPAAARCLVRAGDRVRGGETVVGVLP